MSGISLQERWEAQGNLGYHLALTNEALEIIERRVELPDDSRWQLGFTGLLVSKGQKSLEAHGSFGAMKTTYGNLVMGSQARLTMQPTFTAQELFGYNHPSPNGNTPKMVEGKLAEYVDPRIVALFLNELPHMRNQHPIQPLWERGETIKREAAEPTVLDEAAIYINGNFPNGSTVHPLAQGIRSRLLMQILSGDADEAMARRINSIEEVPLEGTPLIPSAEVRREISQLAAVVYPDSRYEDNTTVVANFTVDLLKALNETGLVMPINLSDARTARAMVAASRAYLWERDARSIGRSLARPEISPIDYLTAAKVAAMVVPTVTKLSGVAEERISEALNGDPPEHLHKAIVARRLIANEAFGVVFNKWSNEIAAGKASKSEDQNLAVLSTDERRAHLRDKYNGSGLVKAHSYANANALRFDVNRVLAGQESTPNGSESSSNGSRRFIRFRSNR